jgi:hypothetical protein
MLDFSGGLEKWAKSCKGNQGLSEGEYQAQ